MQHKLAHRAHTRTLARTIDHIQAVARAVDRNAAH